MRGTARHDIYDVYNIYNMILRKITNSVVVATDYAGSSSMRSGADMLITHTLSLTCSCWVFRATTLCETLIREREYRTTKGCYNTEGSPCSFQGKGFVLRLQRRRKVGLPHRRCTINILGSSTYGDRGAKYVRQRSQVDITLAVGVRNPTACS